MKYKNKVSLLDWRFKFGIFLIVLALLLALTAVVLLLVARFTDRFDSYFGNGFWAIKHYHLHDLLFAWTSLDDRAIVTADISHPFMQVFAALLLLIFLAPISIILGSAFVIRWWIKTRI